MTKLRNSVQLIGHLGMDPKTITFGDNKKMVKYSLATNDYFRDKSGEKQEETQWHNIVTFGKLADISEKYLKKGKEVAISGKIVYRKWESDDGKNHQMTEIVADEIQLVGAK